MAWDDARARSALRTLFDAAVAAADPRQVLAAHLPPRPKGRCIVVGCGKSAAVMAAALEDAWPDVALEGTVVTRYGHAVPTRRIEVIEASHPVPDANSERGARRLLERVRGLGPDDLVLALISGGGSALCAAPAAGPDAGRQAGDQPRPARLGRDDHRDELRAQASLGDQGRPAGRRRPARAGRDAGDQRRAGRRSGGDRLRPDGAGSHHLRRCARDHRPLRHRAARSVAARLAQAADETPKPGELPNAEFHLIATPMMALTRMAETARGLGLAPLVLGDALEGESREMGTVMAGIARSIRAHGQPLRPPAVVLSGGETTVTIGRGPAGHGGRNTEFLLGLAVALGGAADIWAIAGDTDGMDGMDDIAGAIVTPDTLARARAKGLDPRAMLAGHDSHTLFDAIGDAIRTGPTLTNVNDVRAILIA